MALVAVQSEALISWKKDDKQLWPKTSHSESSFLHEEMSDLALQAESPNHHCDAMASYIKHVAFSVYQSSPSKKVAITNYAIR
jgi:hypothetical protein